MSSGRRNQEVRELGERVRALPPGQAGRVGLVLFSYALGTVVLQVGALVVGVSTAFKLVRARQRGVTLATVAWRGPLVPLLVLGACTRTLTRGLVIRWLRRTVRRAGA